MSGTFGIKGSINGSNRVSVPLIRKVGQKDEVPTNANSSDDEPYNDYDYYQNAVPLNGFKTNH